MASTSSLAAGVSAPAAPLRFGSSSFRAFPRHSAVFGRAREPGTRRPVTAVAAERGSRIVMRTHDDAVDGRERGARVAPAALAPRGGCRATARRRATLTVAGGRSVRAVGLTEVRVKETEVARETESSGTEDKAIDRGLGLRRALSDETQSRPFLPLGGEVLHVAWLRSEKESSGKVTRSEAESDRACLEQLLEHYTVEKDEVEEVLDRVARGWSDVTLTLGSGFYCRLQRYSEFDSLTLSGPGEPDARLEQPVPHWNRLLPKGWLCEVPGRVFLCAHVLVRDVDAQPDAPIDDAALWNELQQVTNAIGWERRAVDGGQAGETQVGSAQMEAMEAIAEEIKCLESDDDGECSADFESVDESVDEDDTEAVSEAWEKLPGANRPANTGRRAILNASPAAVVSSTPAGALFKNGASAAPTRGHDRGSTLNGRREAEAPDAECVSSANDEECEAAGENDSDSGVVVRRAKKAKKKKRNDGSSRNARSLSGEYTPARWQSWGTQVESNRIVAADFRRGARFYGNYHLDEEGGMTCMLLSPRGASVIQAARQLQRYFTIEQYRLLILARLPGANSRYPTLAKLNAKYEMVAQSIRRMNKSTSTSSGNWLTRFWKNLVKENVRTYKAQQDFLETITDLEQATAQELARAKSEAATAMAYHEIVETRLDEAELLPLGGEVRFMPPYVRKRLDPAISTINSVAERAQILSDALERTTGLLQAGVEVRLQRLNERIAMYGLVFTIASVFFTAASAICYEGPLKRAFEATVRWIATHPVREWLAPIVAGTA